MIYYMVFKGNEAIEHTKGKNKMFTNKINMENLKTSLKMWTTKSDGYDYGNANVIGEIPWDDDMEEIMPWDKVEQVIDEAIGTPNCSFHLHLILNGDMTEIKRLDDWASTRACEIWDAYNNILEKLNNRCKVIVSKFVKSEDKTYFEEEIYGKTRAELVRKVFEIYEEFHGSTEDEANLDLDKDFLQDFLYDGKKVYVGNDGNNFYYCQMFK